MSKWMWQSTEKEAGTQVSMEKIEQWEVLEIQTKVYGKSTNPATMDIRQNVTYDRAVPSTNVVTKLCTKLQTV